MTTSVLTEPGRTSLGERWREARGLARTTRPGRLATRGAVALVLVVLAGALGLTAVVQGDDAVGDVVDRSGPLVLAGQQLYGALSDADAAAAQAFLAGGAEPPEVRLRYQTDLAVAGTALTALAGSDTAGTAEADPAATRLTTGLPVYAGLVETARTANRQGLSVGAAYLREASGFLQTELLPAASDLYDRRAADLADRQETGDGTLTALAALVVGIVAVVALVGLHRQVSRSTKRRLTPGVLIAAGAVVLALLWGAVAMVTQAALVAEQRSDGTGPAALAVSARFAALQARTAETLTLVARGSGGTYEDEWKRLLPTLVDPGGDLAVADGAAPDERADLDEARTAASAWAATHTRLRALDDGGEYDAAVALALSTAPDGAGTESTRVDAALDRAIGTLSATAAEDAAAASAATTLLAAGIVVLTLVAVGGIVAGLWPRLQEYR